MRSLIRTSLLLLLITGTAAAQSLVTVNGPITDATAATFGGSVRIHLSAPCVYAGTRIEPRDIVVNYGTSGAFTVQLVPNDQCLDDGGGYRTLYTATWIPRGGVTRQENWNVLHTPGTTTVQAVITPTTPPLIQGATGATGSTGAQGPGGAEYTTPTFTSATTVTVQASTHLLLNPAVTSCYDSSGNAFEPGAVAVDVSGNVTITFATAETGTCKLFGGSTSPTIGSWSVDIETPQTADSGLWQHAVGNTYAITSVTCNTDQGTATINLDLRAASAPNASGAAVLGSPLVCAATGTAAQNVSPAVIVTAGSPVALTIMAVSGSPGIVRVHVVTN